MRHFKWADATTWAVKKHLIRGTLLLLYPPGYASERNKAKFVLSRGAWGTATVHVRLSNSSTLVCIAGK